jgi:hypothetical protein
MNGHIGTKETQMNKGVLHTGFSYLVTEIKVVKSFAIFRYHIFFVLFALFNLSNINAQNITYKDFSTGGYYTLEGATFSHVDVIEYRAFLDSNRVHVYLWSLQDGRLVNPIAYRGPLNTNIIGVLNQTIDALQRLSGTGSLHNTIGGVFRMVNPRAESDDHDERIMISVPNGDQWWWGDGGYDNTYGTYSSLYMKFNVYDFSKRRKASFLETLFN